MTGTAAPYAWQESARKKIFERWRDDLKYKALIAACPGAGKTRLGVTIADELLRASTVEVALIAVPTVNVALQWVYEFRNFGIVATRDANNETFKWRRDAHQTMIEDKAGIVITYAQLARDPELFVELARRHPSLLEADEVHHADDDEKFGEALQKLKEVAVCSLALSGTPFNTAGGSIALCETNPGIDQETGKITRETTATYSYAYGDAIRDGVCRPVNFVAVPGIGTATYRSLMDNTVFQKLISMARKTDRIGVFMNADSEYMQQCIREGLTELAKMRAAGDKKAAMLVVARDTTHGGELCRSIELIKQECREWQQFSRIQEIYNDTPAAHAKIVSLVSDSTDIVVSVRMISEGVDVKRLRVGIYATDWMTRMFFIQFIGRFIRYENRTPLDASQYAIVIIPAHIELLKWAREIEIMILAAQLKLDEENGGKPPERKSEMIGAATEAQDASLIFRGTEADYEKDVCEAMYQKSELIRRFAPKEVLDLAKAFGFNHSTGPNRERPTIDWGKRNDDLVTQIVKLIRNQDGGDSTEIYKRVQARANSAVGIQRKDPMTSEKILIKRHEYLRRWVLKIVRKTNPNLFSELNK